MKTIIKTFLMMMICTSISQTAAAKIIEKKISYTSGNKNMIGYIYYNDATTAKRPAVIVVHEWWGLNEYPKMRARMLAELGYVAFCADMYGEGRVVDNPKDAQAAAGEIYKNPSLMKERLNAAYETLLKNPMVNKVKVIAMGYCFGGQVVLNAANMGVTVQAVVSFHGGLSGFKAEKPILNTKVLLCHGAADQFVPEEDVALFKKEMDAIHASYEFRDYEDATHAFTNKASTELGLKFKMPIAYNEKADKASWNDMLLFLKKNNLQK